MPLVKFNVYSSSFTLYLQESKRPQFILVNYGRLEPRSGFEPETYALPWRRSTN